MKRTVLIALAAATLVKLLLAWFTIGTNDVVTWSAFAHNARLCGVCTYTLAGPYGDPFNHPPFIIHFLKLLPDTAMFPFWLRLPSILADIGTAFLVSRLLPGLSPIALALLVLNPISILIAGFHGNTDPVMVFFILLAIYLATQRRFWLAGIAFGMALNIKVVPLLLLPCFLIYVRDRKAFSVGTILTVGLLSLPYLLDIKLVLGHVLGYHGLFTNWGYAHYANMAGAPHDLLTKPLRYTIVLVGIFMPWYLRRHGALLFAACGTVLLAFYFLTPSLALQYLAWGVPFVALLSVRWMASYYLLGGSLIALQYHRWSGGSWVFAESHNVPPATAETEFLSFALWVCCALMIYVLLTRRHREFVPLDVSS